LGRSSGGAFDGGAISTHSQGGSARPFDPSVSNLQTRREQTSRYDSQQSDSYWSRSYSSYGRSWRGGGGGGSQGQQQVAESGIDFYWFIGFFVIVGTPDFLSSSASPSLVLFWCFGLGQIFKGSNQSCEGIRFVVLNSGLQVLVPWTWTGTLLLELEQEWDRGTSLFTRSGTENETTVEYMFRFFRWASWFFLEKVGK
jgi:hypothetical protein